MDPWRRTWIYLGVVMAYAAACLLVSLRLAARHRWRHLPTLPVVFAALHVAWGTGFYAGVWHWLVRKNRV